MRGKLICFYHTFFVAGNIPAYAGKTGRSGAAGAVAKEHPRVCGENADFAGSGVYPLGTSPRMRGKHARGIANPKMPGNIPAYAGKTDKNISHFEQ